MSERLVQKSRQANKQLHGTGTLNIYKVHYGKSKHSDQINNLSSAWQQP